jgi:hypothetical protein
MAEAPLRYRTIRKMGGGTRRALALGRANRQMSRRERAALENREK